MPCKANRRALSVLVMSIFPIEDNLATRSVLVTTSKALVTGSDALVPSSFLLLENLPAKMLLKKTVLSPWESNKDHVVLHFNQLGFLNVRPKCFRRYIKHRESRIRMLTTKTASTRLEAIASR